MNLSVVIATYNPKREYLTRVLDALMVQSLPQERWELLIVDNNSNPSVKDWVDLRWHSRAVVLDESTLGLTHARVRGIKESAGRIVILVDDDNILASDYLEQTARIADDFPFIGTWSGRVEPDFERPDAQPPSELYGLLTLRPVTADLWSNDSSHHASTPWGAGLCIRREVADAYVREVAGKPDRTSLDLQGATMLYGGDTDIAYTGCRMGFGKGVFSKLSVTHLIPAERCTPSHLCRISHGRGYSEVLHGYVTFGVVTQPDWLSVSSVVRHIRTLFKPSLQRSVAFAYQRGRRQAYRDLAVSRAAR